MSNASIKRSRIARWAFLSLLLLAIGTEARGDGPKSVLVLHSYHQGWAWTDRITEGIQTVFQPFDREIALFFEYLDMGRFSHEADFDQLIEMYQLKFAHISFEVIVAAGDGALRLVRRYGNWLFPGVPVVYCAVGPLTFASMETEDAWTGVVAAPDHYATVQLMLALHPDTRRLVFIIDPVVIGGHAMQVFKTQVLRPLAQRVAVETWSAPLWEELPARLVTLGPDDLVYLLAFDPDRSIGDHQAAEIVRLVTRWSPVPVYSSLDFYFGRGIAGGIITTGRHQGEQAGQMALRILSGERAAEIPAMTVSPNHPMFDGRVLRRFHINTAGLPGNSIVIHPSPDLIDRYAFLMIYLVGAMVLLSLLLCIAMWRQKRHQRQLAEINAALDGRVRERSAQLQLVHQRLKKQSLSDGVTGLPNRRYAYQRLVEEVKKAQRYHLPLTILLFDIDWLKGVNSEHGYAVGDMVLRDVAQMIRRTVREIDLVGRYGGEEFLVVLPNTSITQGRQSAERIQQAVAELRWEEGEVRVTVSTGLAQLENQSPADLLKQVSDRLSATKDQGVGRLVEG